jgi:hypothetical protein
MLVAFRFAMRGLVTDRDLELAETHFPGITAFYRTAERKPSTFLELTWLYLGATVPERSIPEHGG